MTLLKPHDDCKATAWCWLSASDAYLSSALGQIPDFVTTADGFQQANDLRDIAWAVANVSIADADLWKGRAHFSRLVAC